MNAHGRNQEELARFGRRADVQVPKAIKPIDVAIPKPPKRRGGNSELKDKLRYLTKRRNLLLAELHEKEAQIYTKKPLQISYQDVCVGVQFYIQSLQNQMQSENYTKAYAELQQTIPNLFIISGEHTHQIYESQQFPIRSNVDRPKLQEKVIFEFTNPRGQNLEIHYIDNNNLATISPNMGATMLRNSDNQVTSPTFGRMSGTGGFFETPLLNELKYGSGWGDD